MHRLSVRQDYAAIAALLGRTSSPQTASVLGEALALREHERVLDIGCGAGGDAELVARTRRARVAGVDLSLPMLALAPIPKVAGDAGALPFRDSTFDAAYAVNVLHLVRRLDTTLAEASRVLRPQGRIALPITTAEQIRDRYINRFFPSLASIDVERYPGEIRLRELLLRAGFDRLTWREADFGPFRIDRRYLERLRSGIFSALLLLPPEELRTGFEALEHEIRTTERRGWFREVDRVRTIVIAVRR